MILTNLKLLIIDDEKDALEALVSVLKNENFIIDSTTSYKTSIEKLKTTDYDIVVTDLKLKDGSGTGILNYIKENNLQASVIIITAFGSVESAVESIKNGAYDYLMKPFRLTDLKKILNQLRKMILLRIENENLKRRLKFETAQNQLIGISRKINEIKDFVKQIADSRSTILITGETGTGKDVVASLIHFQSTRFKKPFIKINCGAIPDNLLETELFGYEKGAFTGAIKQKKGKIEFAHDGTLFLDEIAELDTNMQVKLLRVLQNGEFERLGGTETIKVNVRFIAATNAELDQQVKEGKFREDLFYRLNVISINLPPLREHIEDIPYLIQYFIENYNNLNNKNVQGVDAAVIKMMMKHPWRGNVRELENMVERAVVLAQDKFLKIYHFPMLAEGVFSSDNSIEIHMGTPLDEIEKSIIEMTLRYFNNDKNQVARSLNIGLATLYRKIKEFNI